MDDWEGIDDLILAEQGVAAVLEIRTRWDAPLKTAFELYHERREWLEQVRP